MLMVISNVKIRDVCNVDSDVYQSRNTGIPYQVSVHNGDKRVQTIIPDTNATQFWIWKNSKSVNAVGWLCADSHKYPKTIDVPGVVKRLLRTFARSAISVGRPKGVASDPARASGARGARWTPAPDGPGCVD